MNDDFVDWAAQLVKSIAYLFSEMKETTPDTKLHAAGLRILDAAALMI